MRDYPWSSYRANAEGRADPLHSPHALYRSLAEDERERRAAYRELVRAPMDTQLLDVIRNSTNKGWVLGQGHFQEKTARLAERRAMPLPKGRKKRTEAD